MKRAATWLVSILLAVSTLGATAQGAFAHMGDVWSNSDAFKSTCLGFNDTYPQAMYSLAQSQLALLGYNLSGGLGASFTRSAFLNHVFYDYAVYAHTHANSHSYARMELDPTG